jgi:hypothetical protein
MSGRVDFLAELRGFKRRCPSRRFLGPHIFDRVCMKNGIEHRLLDLSYFPPAHGDRVAKSRARGASPAAQPLSSRHLCKALRLR